jgi:predicted ATPase with chaperone activity
VIRVAQTVSDLAAAPAVTADHVLTALGLRQRTVEADGPGGLALGAA